MKNAKQLICDNAVLLFNQKGYANVSLREIAKVSGMAVGNLTYYFKKKDDLVAAIVSGLLDDYSRDFTPGLTGESNLQNLLLTFRKTEESHEKYSFFFKNMGAITASSEYFSKMKKEFQKMLYAYYFSSLSGLQKDGIIKPCFSSRNIEDLAFAFTHLFSNWCEMGGPGSLPEFSSFSLSETFCSLLLPFLSKEYVPKLNVLFEHSGGTTL